MIQYAQKRDKQGEIFHFATQQRTSSQARAAMVVYELGFGATVVELTPTRIVLQTRILGDIDTVTLEGSAEEMRDTVVTAAYYAMTSDRQDQITEAALGMLDTSLGESKYRKGMSPFILKMASPLIIGHTRVALAAMLAAGIEDESQIAYGLSITKRGGMARGLTDFLAVLELAIELGTTLQEVDAQL